jgi:hypothetical protein
MDSGRRRAEEILEGMGLPVPVLQRPEKKPAEDTDASKSKVPLYVGVGAALAGAIAFAALSRKK